MSDTRNTSRDAPRIDIFRTPLGRARGLGTAHSGAASWWAHTLGSIALVPLTLWFVISMVGLVGASRDDVALWLGRPLPLALMLILIVITFQHMRHGIETVLEDYIQNSPLKMVAVMVIRAVTAVVGLLCVISVLRIGL